MMTPILNKVPSISVSFWILKICATTLGETAGDLLSMTLKIGYAISSILLLACFIIVLVIQLKSQRYLPLLYWFVILMTSTAGTTMSDFLDRSLMLGYAIGSMFLISCLIVILFIWQKKEKSISVSNIQSVRGELFYWSTILISNTLGTALGDFLADSSGLGFAGGALLIGTLLIITVILFYYTLISHIILFWIAFILTRPFGATLGDLLTKPLEKGGLNFGTFGASLFLFSILIIFINFETVKNKQLLLNETKTN